MEFVFVSCGRKSIPNPRVGTLGMIMIDVRPTGHGSNTSCLPRCLGRYRAIEKIPFVSSKTMNDRTTGPGLAIEGCSRCD